MRIHPAAVEALITEVRPKALRGFAPQIEEDIRKGTPRARRIYKRNRPHTPLWLSVTTEYEDDSAFIGSRRPYQSVAEFGQRRDGSYRWRDQSRTLFMKRALYQKRIGRLT